jgi:outer membrane autotransporter protein
MPGGPLIAPAQAWNYTTCASEYLYGSDPGYPLEWSNPDCWYHGHIPTEDDDEVIINDDGDSRAQDRFGAYEIGVTPKTMATLGKSSINLRTLIIGNNADIYADRITDGILNVGGSGVVLQMSGDLTIGRNGGNGYMYVRDGAYVWAENLYMGGYRDDDGSAAGWGTGNMTLSGAGTVMQIHRDILLGPGHLGVGNINVRYGATLITTNANLSPFGRINLDNGTMIVKGTLTVQGQPETAGDSFFHVGYGSVLSATEIRTVRQTEVPDSAVGSLEFNQGTLYLRDMDGLISTPATTIYGDFDYTNGMTVAVDASLLNDQPDLVVHGNAVAETIGGREGISWSVVPSASGYAPALGQDFVLAQYLPLQYRTDASGDASAEPAPVEVAADSGLAFVDAVVTEHVDSTHLTFTRNAVGFGDAAVTDNENAIGGHLESLAPGHALHDAFLGLPSGTNLRAAYNALTGEIHSAANAALAQSTLDAANVVQDRVAATLAPPEQAEPAQLLGYVGTPPESSAISAIDGLVVAGPAPWMQAFGTLSSLRNPDGNGTVDAASGGVVVGGDAALDATTRAGVGVGYSHAAVAQSNGLSRANIEAFHALAYGGMRVDEISLRGGLGVTASAVSSTRWTGLQALPEPLRAAYGAFTGQAFAEAAFDIETADFTLQPYAGASVVSTFTGAHSESGNAAALTTEASLNNSVYTTLGLRARQTLVLENGNSIAVSGGIGWQHLLGGVHHRSAHFDGGAMLDLRGPAPETDMLILDAGLEFDLRRGPSVALDYTGRLGLGSQQHGMKATLGHQF